MFAPLETFLKTKLNRLVSRESAETLASGAAWDIEEQILRTSSRVATTGVMRRNLTRVWFPRKRAFGYEIYVGKGGWEDTRADSGTIKAFLEDFPQYHSSFPFDRKRAWWALSLRARRELMLARARGKYGGKVGESAYYLLQEEGFEETGIQERHFIALAMDEFPLRVTQLVSSEFTHA